MSGRIYNFLRSLDWLVKTKDRITINYWRCKESLLNILHSLSYEDFLRIKLKRIGIELGLRSGMIIIGAPKTGTTALFDYLSLHPDTAPSLVKEVDFFNCPARYERGTKFYHSHFPANYIINRNKLAYEASPACFVQSKVPERMHDYNSDLKLIAILRDPVKRAYSDWNMHKGLYEHNPEWAMGWMDRCAKGHEQRDNAVERDLERFSTFMGAIEEEVESNARGEALISRFLNVGLYAEHLENYYKYFSKDQILIIENDEMKADSLNTLKQVEKFLGLKPHQWNTDDVQPVFSGKYSDPIPEESEEFLIEYYREYNEKLFELIGRRFNWL
jgi:hypothetical protein